MIDDKDAEQDVKIAVLESTLENATRRMELIHKRIDRTDERITKLNEDVRERIRALEKWVWGAGAVLTAFVVIGVLLVIWILFLIDLKWRLQNNVEEILEI